MTSLKKQNIKIVMKYTWPIYIVSAVLVAFLLSFIFGIVHKLPDYKTLTLFISGEVIDSKKLEKDLLEKYQDKELQSVTTISALPSDSSYDTKLTVAGFTSADILILPLSELSNRKPSTFGLDLTEEIIASYYQDKTIYKEEDMGYGIKINKDAVKEYMALQQEDYYMILNANSENIGQYSKTQIKEHDLALQLVKEWGI